MIPRGVEYHQLRMNYAVHEVATVDHQSLGRIASVMCSRTSQAGSRGRSGRSVKDVLISLDVITAITRAGAHQHIIGSKMS